jgi:HlyD family secretion protein
MARQIYRKKALDRLASPEQLDQLLTIVSPMGWLALLALVALVIWAIVWGFTGTIPTKVMGRGVLMKEGTEFTIEAEGQGLIQELFVEENDLVRMGQLVVRIQQAEVLDKIQAARKQVKLLEKKLKKTEKFESGDLELNSQALANERENLRLSNKFLKERVQWLKNRLEQQKKLARQGLITPRKVEETKDKLNDNQKKIHQNTNKIKQLKIKLLQLKNQNQEDLLKANQELEQAQADLKELLTQLKTSRRVVSPYTGRIIDLDVQRGSEVHQGSPIMTLEVIDSDMTYLEAVTFFPPREGKRIQVGMEAMLSPSTVKAEKYGKVIGLVTYVSPFPVTLPDMQRTLQNEDLVKALTTHGPPIEVHIALVPNPHTPSGYRWTSSAGPPVQLQSGTETTCQVEVKRRRPVELIVPLFRHYVLGAGSSQKNMEKK